MSSIKDEDSCFNMTPPKLQSLKKCSDDPKTDPELSKNSGDRKEAFKPRQNSLKYYAVSTPESVPSVSSLDFVFDDLTKALTCCKKLTSKNVRFKAFSSLDEAREFVSSSSFSQTNSPKVFSESPISFPEEKGPNFPSVSSQQLVVLRQEIERGRESDVLEKVWSNPRYLVGSSDSLAILHAGTRYNAFHVAAKANQTSIFYSLLNTVQDPRFLTLLHPEMDGAMLGRLKEHLLDLCLNMPCKPMHETPLHVAAKVGAVFIVRIMLSYDICERKPNKHGKVPNMLTCERCPELTLNGEPVKKMMQGIFEGESMLYVPVVRDKGKDVLAFSHDVCSEEFVASFIASRKVKDHFLSVDSNPVFGAFAGPLSKQSAELLSNALKKKNFNHGFQFSVDQKSELKAMCLSDFSKGLERVGRILACSVNCDYLEFFPAVDDYLSSKTGLQVLECHLKCLRKLNHLKSLMTAGLSSQEMCRHFVTFVDEVLLDAVCQRLKLGFDVAPFIGSRRVSVTFYFIHLFQDIIPTVLCLTLTSFHADGDEDSRIHDEIAHLLLLKSLCVFDKAALHTLVMHLNSVLYLVHDFQSRNYQQFLCLLKFFCYHHLNERRSPGDPTLKADEDFLSKPVCTCFISDSRHDQISHPLYRNTLFAFPTRLFLDSVSEQKKAYDGTKTFFMQGLLEELNACLNPTSAEPAPDEAESSDSDDVFYLAPETDSAVADPDIIEMYVTGTAEFSSRDLDVYRWMEKTSVSESSYPHVFRYKSLVELKLGTLMEQKTELTLTPASSSTALERVMRLRALHRKALFK